MTEAETRKILEAYCEELDRERTSESARLRRFLLPAALGLAIAGCSETPIALPYLGPMPDGLPDYRRPDLRGPDAGPGDAGPGDAAKEWRRADAAARDGAGEK